MRLYPKYRTIVWRSYELLREAYKRGLINNFEEELMKYGKETGHKFPRKRR